MVRRIRLRHLRIVVGVVVAIMVVVLIAGCGSSKKSTPSYKRSTPKPTGTEGKGTGAEVSSLLAGIPQPGSTLGDPKAPVTLQYFGDLECPFCKQFMLGALPSLIRSYVRGGKLKIEYRSLETATRDPQTFKTQQVAALAAGKQNRMWEYIELFYHEQGRRGQRLRHRKLPPGTGAAGARAEPDRLDRRTQRHGTSSHDQQRRAGRQQCGLDEHPVLSDRQDRGRVSEARNHLADRPVAVRLRHRSAAERLPHPPNSQGAESAGVLSSGRHGGEPQSSVGRARGPSFDQRGPPCREQTPGLPPEWLHSPSAHCTIVPWPSPKLAMH